MPGISFLRSISSLTLQDEAERVFFYVCINYSFLACIFYINENQMCFSDSIMCPPKCPIIDQMNIVSVGPQGLTPNVSRYFDFVAHVRFQSRLQYKSKVSHRFVK